MKNKPIIPSLREKKRYIAFEVISKQDKCQSDSVKNAILGKTASLFGNMMMGDAGIQMIMFNQEKQKGILRVSNKFVNHLKSGFLFVDKIGSNEVVVQSIKSSGILKKVKPMAA